MGQIRELVKITGAASNRRRKFQFNYTSIIYARNFKIPGSAKKSFIRIC